MGTRRRDRSTVSSLETPRERDRINSLSSFARVPSGMDSAVSCSAAEGPIPDSSRRERRKHATGRSRCTERTAFRAAPRNEIQATPIPGSTAETVACASPAAVRLTETTARKTTREKSSANAQCRREGTRQAPGKGSSRLAISRSVKRSWAERYIRKEDAKG